MATSKGQATPSFFSRSIEWITELLTNLSNRIRFFVEVLSSNFYTFILLIVIYLFYWTFPQAKDLLLTINQEHDGQIFLFFTSLITLAAISWYMPRVFYNLAEKRDKPASGDYEATATNSTMRDLYMADFSEQRWDYNQKAPDDHAEKEDCYRKHFREMMPRILAASLLFLVTLGILNVGNEMNNTEFPWRLNAGLTLKISLLILITILLFERGQEPVLMSFNRWLNKRFEGRAWWFIGSVLVLITLLRLTKAPGEDGLPAFFGLSILLSFAFLIFTIIRKQIPFFQNDNLIRVILATTAISLSLFFILINCIPSLAQHLNPLVCANLAFVCYLTILYGVRLWGASRGIAAVFFLFVFIFTMAGLTNSFRLHQVSLTERLIHPKQRLSLEVYFNKWLNSNQESIKRFLAEKPGRKFPVVVVSAEGGGSRAAYWTSSVHKQLEKEIPSYYEQHLFAMTGASGGSTGNSTYFAMKQGGVNTTQMDKKGKEMFEQNYLSSSLTLLLGADLVKDIFGIPLGKDRAKRLEREWTESLQGLIGEKQENAFEAPYLSLWYDTDGKKKVKVKPAMDPLLFINTTQVQGDGHAIFSPVQVDTQHYEGIDILAALAKEEDKKAAAGHTPQTVPLITANLLNASFPYINPAGHIGKLGSFVDAGYFDNYGARTGAGILKSLLALREAKKETQDSLLYQQLEFVSVLIRNSTVEEKQKSEVPRESGQLTAPLGTMANLRTAFNAHNFWDLENSADHFYLVDLKKVKMEHTQRLLWTHKTDEISPIVPLARYLSPVAINAMDVSLDALSNDPDSDLYRLINDRLR
ncbi:MAG: hypothetical protein HRU41_37845 [Saprospiraceae bacterium]|nr:hypothetical protein [Saprospiraceae bacterium]